jgi:hypothetical protein
LSLTETHLYLDGTLLVMSKAPRVYKCVLVALVVALVLVGCGEASGGKPSGAESEGTSSAGGPTVGEGVAKVELEPVDNFSTSGIATFEEVSDLGVEVELELEGLPKSGVTYYAHLHKGGCVYVLDKHGDHGHQEARPHGRVGVALALVLPERLLAQGSGPEYAHGAHNHGHEHEAPDEELPGNIGSPVPLSSSNTGTASVTAILRGVTLEQLSSGDPEYRLEVHASGSEDAPMLACGTLGKPA